MAILEIKKYPNPILRKKAEEVKEINQEIKEISQNMVETLISKEGVGLAAPQVGALKRIIIVQAGKGPQVFVNPKITKKSKETIIDEEGCLNFPGLFLKIKRARGVEIKALDVEGKEIQIKVEGMPARIFQHEIDHLDGILFIDKVNFLQRWKIRKKLREFKKQYGSCGFFNK